MGIVAWCIYHLRVAYASFSLESLKIFLGGNSKHYKIFGHFFEKMEFFKEDVTTTPRDGLT